MYKNVPSWTETVNLLVKLGYMICDWRKIGSHATRTPVEMDMIFIPNFSKESGEKLIKERKRIYYFNAYIWANKTFERNI